MNASVRRPVVAALRRSRSGPSRRAGAAASRRRRAGPSIRRRGRRADGGPRSGEETPKKSLGSGAARGIARGRERGREPPSRERQPRPASLARRTRKTGRLVSGMTPFFELASSPGGGISRPLGAADQSEHAESSLRLLSRPSPVRRRLPAGAAFAQADSNRTTFLLSRALRRRAAQRRVPQCRRLPRPAHRAPHRLRVRRHQHRPGRHQRPHRRLRGPPRWPLGPQRHALAHRRHRPRLARPGWPAGQRPLLPPGDRRRLARHPELRGLRLRRVQPGPRRHQRQARRLRLQPEFEEDHARLHRRPRAPVQRLDLRGLR